MARETWVQSQVESYKRLKKMIFDASLLNTQHYKVRIKGKVEQSREGVAPSPTHWCSSYRKGSLRVTLDYGRQVYFTYYSVGAVCRLIPLSFIFLGVFAVFLFLSFLSSKSSSFCVNSPSLIFYWLMIIFVIGSCVTFGGFPSKFLKCFHRCFHSS